MPKTYKAIFPALMLVLGLSLGLADASTGGVAGGVGRALPATAVRIPAIWVCVGVATTALGWVPRWTAAIGWGALALFLVVGEFGGLLGLPGWVIDLTPFTHVPRMPVEPFSWAPTLWLLLVAAALLAAGVVGYRRRDVG